MRIIQLGPFPPPYGGVQANLVGILRHLRSKNIPSGVINLNRHRKESGGGIYYPKTALETARLLFQLPAKILHLHLGGTVPPRMVGLCILCGSIPGRKAVLSFHSGGYPSSPQGRAAKPGSLRGFAFRRFDRIIVVNRELAEVFERYGVPRERIRLILPHAVDLDEMAPSLPEPLAQFYAKHHQILVTVGLLEPEYDLPGQIDVLEKVLEVYPQCGLVIIGSGDLEQDIRQRIAAKPYRDHILLTGDVPHPATLRAIASADMLLRTTLYDGDAVSVREALCIGTPVIATDNSLRPPGLRLIPISDRAALLAGILEQLKKGKTDATTAASGKENLDEVLAVYEELDPT